MRGLVWKLAVATWLSVSLCAAEKTSGKESNESQAQTCISRTLKAIHEDLQALKDQFPQLADIEKGRVLETTFYYAKGARSVGKVPNPKLDKDGCCIDVDLELYDPRKEPDRLEHYRICQKVWDHYEMNDGSRYAVWTYVLAEANKPGADFRTRVQKIVSERLAALHKELGARPIESPAR